MLIFMLGGVLMTANALWLAMRALRSGDPATVRRNWRVLLPGWVDLVGFALLVIGQLLPFEPPLTAVHVAVSVGAALLVLIGVSVAKAQFLSWVFLYLSARSESAARSAPDPMSSTTATKPDVDELGPE